MGREFELKFAATKADHEALRSRFRNLSPISMETTYYDTPDGALSSRHITLRWRMENAVSVCTVKTPISEHGRGEWELECDDIYAAIPQLCKLGATEELLALTCGGIVPVCGAKFTRKAKLLKLERCTVEIALDQGALLGGDRELPIREVEVELKDGGEEAAVAFAAELAKEYGLTPENRSKFRRAQLLARGE